MLRPALLHPLIILIVIGILGVFRIVRALPPESPGDRALADMRACERRVGILPPTDPGYQISREARYASYAWCMVTLGYTFQGHALTPEPGLCTRGAAKNSVKIPMRFQPIDRMSLFKKRSACSRATFDGWFRRERRKSHHESEATLSRLHLRY